MIESISNKQIKHLAQLQTKAKARREEGLYVVEGVRMFREIPRPLLVKTYASWSFLKKKENRDLLAGMDVEEVLDGVFSYVSATKTPQGILSVVRQQTYALSDLFQKEPPLLLLLEGIQDPGNLGTIFRTAEAAGVSGIVMTGCADIYNPKTVRATMGALYRMPFVCAGDFRAAFDACRARQVRIHAAQLQGECAYTQKDYRGGCAFLVGNEGNGLSQEAASLADGAVKIPMSQGADSLNAAVATAVLLFEAKRQRDAVKTFH